MLLTAVVSTGATPLRIRGPVLTIDTHPERALDAFDELHDSLTDKEWGAPDGGPVTVSGRVHFVAERHHAPTGPAVCVYSTSDGNRTAARARAVRARLAAQLEQAAQLT